MFKSMKEHVSNWFVDTMARTETLDLYFIITDLLDIPLTPHEKHMLAEGDAASVAAAHGVVVSNGHVYVKGEDKGPVGKAVL